LRAPAKTFQDALEKGGVGVSGDLSEHDGQCAAAGAAALQHRPIVEAPRS
jgi:uncharacterized protein GlcG (DUF336 family)